MCANARNTSQHVGSFDENTKDSGTFSISDAMLISCSHAFSFPELRSSWPAPRIESSGRCPGRFQSVLATDWSDGNTIKMITGRNRKRMAEGILLCNRYIISNNHPLDLFGEKTIREEIVRD